MEQNWFRKRYGLDDITPEEYELHKKRLILMSLFGNDGKITSPPKLTPIPKRTFKTKLKFNFTPVPTREMKELTADQIVDYHPYIRKLKKAIKDDMERLTTDDPFQI